MIIFKFPFTVINLKTIKVYQTLINAFYRPHYVNMTHYKSNHLCVHFITNNPINSEKKDDEKIGKTSSNDESSSVVKEGKIKQTPETSKLDITATPKASQKTESFKRKNETEKIVVNILFPFFVYLSFFWSF